MADHRLAFEVDGSQAAAGVAKFEKELDRAIAAAARFHSALEKTFGRSTSSAVSGLRALSGALTSLNRAGNAAKSLESLSRALAKLSNAKSIANELRKFISAISSIKIPPAFQNLVKALNSIATAANRANKSLALMNKSLNSGQIKGFVSAANNANNSMRRMNSTAQVMGGTLLGLGFYQVSQRVLNFGKNVFNVSASMVKFTATMRAATGTLQGVDDGLAFIRNLTQTLGTPLLESAEKFSKFAIASQAAGASISDAEKIFEAMSVALTAVGSNSQDAALAFLAIEQMMSKGRVSAEELRRQLSERIPGAFGLMANAMKVSTAELDRMLRLGQVMSKDALPKLADELLRVFSPALETSLKGPVVALGKLKNAFTELMIIVGESGFIEALTTQMNALTASISSPSFKQFAASIGQIGAVLINVLGVGLRIVTDNIFIMTPIIVLLSMRIVAMAASFFNLNNAMSLFNVGLLTTGRNASVASTGLNVFNIQTARTNMLLNASTLGIGRFAGAVGLVGRTVGMVVPFIRAFILALTVLTALAPTITNMLKSLGVLPTNILTAEQAATKLNQTLNTTGLTAKSATSIFVGLSNGLKSNKEEAMRAADSVVYYRSVWSGWLIRHKAELDGVTTSLVELARKFATGALSVDSLSTALKKVDLNGASEQTKNLYEKLTTLAAKSAASKSELQNLATAIKTARDKAKEAGQDTSTYDLILSKLKKTSAETAAGQGGLAKKTKEAGNEFDIAAVKSAKYASKLDAVNAKFKALGGETAKGQSWAEKMRRSNVDTSVSLDAVAESSTGAASSINVLSNTMATGANQALDYASAMQKAAQSMTAVTTQMGSGSTDTNNLGGRTTSGKRSYGVSMKGASFDAIYGSIFGDTAKEAFSKSYTGDIGEGLLKKFQEAVDSVDGYYSLNRKPGGLGNELSVSGIPNELEKLFKSIQNKASSGGLGSEMAAFIDVVNKYSAEQAAKQSEEINSTDANTIALNDNTAVVSGLGSDYADLINQLYNKLDLARKNLSSYYGNPSGMWNSDTKGISTIPGYADGFKGVVGGNGGVDNNMMVARVSRGEGVEITPKSEMNRGGFSSNKTGGVVMNVYANDADSFLRNEAKVKTALARAVKSAQSSGRA